MARRAVPLVLLVAVSLAALCGCDPAPEIVPAREGRFGTLRDLVLFERGEDEGGDFFLDRFEVTRSDWADWLSATGAGPVSRPASSDRLRPVAGVTLAEARRFAAWRFCRVQRWSEWQFASSDRNRSLFPWGDPWYPTYANTAELELFESTLVGTFESGRRGQGPYDLIGNVAEWTETPPPGWFGRRNQDPPKAEWYQAHVDQVRSHPALRPWFLGNLPLPSATLQLGPMPRLVVGWSFKSRVQWPPPLDDPASGLQHLPESRSDALGARLAVSPRELLQTLLALGGRLQPAERAALTAFLAVPGHAEALARAWSSLPTPRPRGGEAAKILEDAVGG